MMFANKKILAFFAHPDDETLGAGGTISKLARAGNEVYVAIPGAGIYARRNQKEEDMLHREKGDLNEDFKSAMEILGVKPEHIFTANFPDNEMDKGSRLELIHWLESVLAKIKPDVIFTHHRFCTNIDHQYCHEAAVIAARPAPGSQIAIISSEIPSSTGYLKPAMWEPNFYVEIHQTDLQNKIKAMSAYKNEVRPYPHPRSPEILEALAKVRGSEAGFNFAEAFMIQKVYN